MIVDTDKLKALALAAKDWNWETVQGDQFGHLNDDDVFYDIGTIDADQYGVDDTDHNSTVLNFIAAANPATVLALIAEVERLRAAERLLREARAALETWQDVVPAVSLCADIDSAIEASAKAEKEEACGS